MFHILSASLRTGRVTTGYPWEPEAAPPAYRGQPTLDLDRCDRTGACVAACPAAAIAVITQRWELDLARCVFCGLCAEACPNAAIALSADFELAARRRADLVLGADLRSQGTLPETGDVATRAAATSALSGLARRLNDRIHRLLRRSLHIRHMDAGSDNSTDWELNALLNPVYNVQRLGIDFVASPRHADLLLVTGAVTRNLEMALRRTYEAMPEPRLVVAAGAEACGGGVLQGAYAVAGGVDRCLPVDVYIPGDPPRPQAIIQGLLIAMDRLKPKLPR
ncbi:MAG: 4Fe-4S binding protein [Chloroflexi bacterium]|nr:4Fe-4S binding protein [Chloroflexota bacterium]